ncbi:MAG: type II toxin-antitoxin system RelE family toxin [Thermomicrobiales bacterium]
MRCTVDLSPRAQRDLKRLPQAIRTRILARLEALSDDPRPVGSRLLSSVKGYYRLRVGDCRAIYSIEDDRLFVLVVKVGHRRDVYR